MKFLVMILLGLSLLFSSIDINNASKKELSSLNGIGTKKAELIIAYRDINCFKNIDELVKIKGIGKKIVDKNKGNISVGTCKK